MRLTGYSILGGLFSYDSFKYKAKHSQPHTLTLTLTHTPTYTLSQMYANELPAVRTRVVKKKTQIAAATEKKTE